jgi:DNA-binding response OmpR family regulator
MTDDAGVRATILLVEDDPTTRGFLAAELAADGYLTIAAGTLEEGRELLESEYPDLALLDLCLPDGSGLDLLRNVRGADGIASRVDPRTPVLVLSGRTSEVDRLRGFERGCDDYLAKPFSYPELRARVAALLRRTQDRPHRGRLRIGALEVDPAGREVRLRGERLELSAKEFGLLRMLAREPTKVWTKDELLRTVWGYDTAVGSTRTLDSHACRLRHKLAVQGDHFVVNVWGVGYRLVDGVGEAP